MLNPLHIQQQLLHAIMGNMARTDGLRVLTDISKPFKDEAQTALFKDPIRTAQ